MAWRASQKEAGLQHLDSFMKKLEDEYRAQTETVQYIVEDLGRLEEAARAILAKKETGEQRLSQERIRREAIRREYNQFAEARQVLAASSSDLTPSGAAATIGEGASKLSLDSKIAQSKNEAQTLLQEVKCETDVKEVSERQETVIPKQEQDPSCNVKLVEYLRGTDRQPRASEQLYDRIVPTIVIDGSEESSGEDAASRKRRRFAKPVDPEGLSPVGDAATESKGEKEGRAKNEDHLEVCPEAGGIVEEQFKCNEVVEPASSRQLLAIPAPIPWSWSGPDIPEVRRSSQPVLRRRRTRTRPHSRVPSGQNESRSGGEGGQEAEDCDTPSDQHPPKKSFASRYTRRRAEKLAEIMNDMRRDNLCMPRLPQGPWKSCSTPVLLKQFQPSDFNLAGWNDVRSLDSVKFRTMFTKYQPQFAAMLERTSEKKSDQLSVGVSSLLRKLAAAFAEKDFASDDAQKLRSDLWKAAENYVRFCKEKEQKFPLRISRAKEEFKKWEDNYLATRVKEQDLAKQTGQELKDEEPKNDGALPKGAALVGHQLHLTLKTTKPGTCKGEVIHYCQSLDDYIILFEDDTLRHKKLSDDSTYCLQSVVPRKKASVLASE